MGREISLFPNYDADENRTTNYCLLLLKMLYEENPKFLSEVLDTLIDETEMPIGDTVGVKFTQQQKQGKRIIDGQISQHPLTIRIETKRGDQFCKDQLKGHLEALKEVVGNRVLVALGNIERQSNDYAVLECIRNLCKESAVTFAVISFEDFLQALKLDYLPKNLADAVEDLTVYFNERGLLSSWQNRLDVVNCARSFDEVLRDKAYTCPAEGGKYSHKRCQYFGTYRNRCVERVALIEALVDLQSEDIKTHTLRWKNVEVEDKELIEKARVIHQRLQGNRYPLRVFLLSGLYATNFVKGTPGGMFGVKKYFDVSSLNANDAFNLAAKLKDKTWQSYIE